MMSAGRTTVPEAATERPCAQKKLHGTEWICRYTNKQTPRNAHGVLVGVFVRG